MSDASDKLLQIDQAQEEAGTEAKAKRLGLQYVDITRLKLEPDVLKLLPEDQIKSLQIIPLKVDKKVLLIGVVDPQNSAVKQGIEALEQTTGFTLVPVLISSSSFAAGYKSLELLVRDTGGGDRPVVITEKRTDDLMAIVGQLRTTASTQAGNVTDVLSAILFDATQKLASDIHFEPVDQALLVRYRIDGVLHKEFSVTKEMAHGLTSRVKYLAKMPLAATVEPQDGRFTINVLDQALDLRVATLPTIYGDMITIRILKKDQVLRKLDQLGVRSDLETMIRGAFTKPHGMILVTGPTGSGKTTTLYAILQELNTEERKIITIEDPVEYKIEGLEQSQIDADRGYSFVDALRGALRQDPDVLMVGEIRDKETATIGIRAALTGRILLATMHANNAPGAYSRLLEMGVEPFLFSGSINIVIAQRLVRLLCPACKKPHVASDSDNQLLMKELGRSATELFEPVGCPACGGIGYKGRVALFEAFTPSHAMEQLALLKSSVSVFEEQAQKDGMITMLQDGLLKVEQGLTSIAEVLRVTSE